MLVIMLPVIVSEAECVKQDLMHCRFKDTSSVKDTKEFDMDYDILVIAVGATFKEAEDALKIRQTVINCLERASLPDISEEDYTFRCGWWRTHCRTICICHIIIKGCSN